MLYVESIILYIPCNGHKFQKLGVYSFLRISSSLFDQEGNLLIFNYLSLSKNSLCLNSRLVLD